MNLEYSEAVGEVLQILKHTEKSLIDKIPKKLLDFWERNSKLDSSLDMHPQVDKMNLKPKSKALIGMIYRNYWCNAEERKEYDQILKRNEERFQEEARKKYNPDDIFKPKIEPIINVVEETEQSEKKEMICYKENIFAKIIQKIKSLFENKRKQKM